MGTITREDQDRARQAFARSQEEYDKGNMDVAEQWTRSAMSVWEQGDDDAARLAMSTCYNNLGRIHEERGQMDEGIAFHRQCLALRRAVLGEDHAETAFSLGNLGTALAAAGQWQEAMDTLTACLDCHARLGINNPLTAGWRQNLEVCQMALADEG